MRKVTGKKKDMENGDGDDIDTVESEAEENGIDDDGRFGLAFFSSWGIQFDVHFVYLILCL